MQQSNCSRVITCNKCSKCATVLQVVSLQQRSGWQVYNSVTVAGSKNVTGVASLQQFNRLQVCYSVAN